MQYTYKDECFISDKSDVHGIIMVLVLVCVDVLLFFAAIGFYLWKESGVPRFLGDLQEAEKTSVPIPGSKP